MALGFFDLEVEAVLAVVAHHLVLGSGTTFEKQSDEYKESVLPKSVRKRVAVEALSDFGWYRYVGLDGKVICMKTFGASGPANQLFEHFGFTVENVVNTVKSLF